MVHEFIAGIDIGGRKIAVAIAARGVEIITLNSFPTAVIRAVALRIKRHCQLNSRRNECDKRSEARH